VNLEFIKILFKICTNKAHRIFYIVKHNKEKMKCN